MAVATQIRRALYALLLIFAALLWLAALLLFSKVAENSHDFARWQSWILPINSIGIGVLLVLIVSNLVRLVRDYRRHVPGTRLKARMVGLLVILAITPLLVVYVFSVEFINRGIDEWFNVDVERGLSDALQLSQTALEQEERENLSSLKTIAERLGATDSGSIVDELGKLRRQSRATHLTLFGGDGRIIGTSSDEPSPAVPSYPTEELLVQLRQGSPYVSLEPRDDGAYQIIAAVPVGPEIESGHERILRAIFPVEQRLGALANDVQSRYNQFAELSFLRSALKYAFTLTLSLVLLISALASVYGAFFSARRLVIPIQQLMQATRAVARGDFDTRLPTPARDEIGFLVNSFNDMTQRLAQARQEARLSEQQVESERRKLEVILARLSTGVVSLEADMRLRTANQAAGAMLGVDLESHVGESLTDLAESRPLLKQFLAVNTAHAARGETDWREQIVLKGDVGRRVLMCACSALPSDGDSPGGYVVVFDDITALLQAQREAAWGEVARRLAHEIKNPLTPIQLSAERLRRRYLRADSKSLELLDRATHTIIQQVEAMKEMVNAFSQYARTPAVEWSRFDLNELISQVTELYRHQKTPVAIKISFDAGLPNIEADENRLRQVFHNLMRNAIEATEHQKDARIDISTRYVNAEGVEMVEVKVSDNGPGFSGELLHQAFEPYVTSKAKGTGLGLAIVKKLVEEHGGQIQARNGERGGAEISILLPLTGESRDTWFNMRHNGRRERA